MCVSSSVTLLTSDSIVFFQAEDGIRDLVRSRGLGDVYKRQARMRENNNAVGKYPRIRVFTSVSAARPVPSLWRIAVFPTCKCVMDGFLSVKKRTNPVP